MKMMSWSRYHSRSWLSSCVVRRRRVRNEDTAIPRDGASSDGAVRGGLAIARPAPVSAPPRDEAAIQGAASVPHGEEPR